MFCVSDADVATLLALEMSLGGGQVKVLTAIRLLVDMPDLLLDCGRIFDRLLA